MKTGLKKLSTKQSSPLNAMVDKVLSLRKIKQPTPAQRLQAKRDVFKAAHILDVKVSELAKAFN